MDSLSSLARVSGFQILLQEYLRSRQGRAQAYAQPLFHIMSKPHLSSVKAHLAGHNAKKRPLLTLLNGDNSWLMSFPRPPAERTLQDKAFYHVVLDPWLTGDIVIGAPWLVSAQNPARGSIKDGTAVEDLVREIEAAANIPSSNNMNMTRGTSRIRRSGSPIDAILLTSDFRDHTHKPTLLTFSSNIPVFATAAPAKVVRGWKYFASITEIPNLDTDNPNLFALRPRSRSYPKGCTPGGGRGSPSGTGEASDGKGGALGGGTTDESGSTPSGTGGRPNGSGDTPNGTDEVSALPNWLTIFRLPGHNPLAFGISVIYPLVDGRYESLVYSPHGIKASCPSIQALTSKMDPPVEVAVMLSTVKMNWAARWIKTNLGIKEVLELERVLKPRWWVVTHSKVVEYGGMFSWLLGTRDAREDLEAALEGEKKRGGEGRRPRVVEVEDGGCFVVE